MSEITKLLAAAGLLAAGFFGASMFGSPAAGDSATGAPGDWTPQRLEPLGDASALSLAQPPVTRDENVAPVSHTDENQFAMGGSSAIEHSAARPVWPGGATSGNAPEIRRSPTNSQTSLNSSFEDASGMPTPPPLFTAPTHAAPMRRSGFPPKPSSVTLPPAVTGGQPDSSSGPSLSAPQSNSTSEWPNNNWGSAGEVRGLAPLSAGSTSGSAELVWHVVKDGDNLADIAKRYLGDPHRAREIYELNQDRLQSPDLLPIGAELRIPERSTGPSVFSVFDSNGAASTSFAPQSRLVPLPELPESVRQSPRARLQPPVSATLVNSP